MKQITSRFILLSSVALDPAAAHPKRVAKLRRNSLLVRLLTLGVVFAFTLQPTEAANWYFDANGTTTGGGDPCNANVSGGANWSPTDSGTAPVIWVAGNTCVFSAGTPANTTATCNSGITAAGIIVENGTVVIAGPNAITIGAGTITIASGTTLSIDNSATISASAGATCTLNGGTFRNSNTSTAGTFLTPNCGIVLGAGGGSVSANGGSGIISIYTGLISGTGPLTIAGNGVFRLTTTTATYSGATTISGTLQISTTANVLPSGTDLTLSGTIDLQNSLQVGSLTGAGGISMRTFTLTVGGSTSPAAFSGVISDGGYYGRITKQGTGTLTLSGANTYDGTFTLTAGTVTVNSAGALCGAVCDVVINGGILNLNNSAQTVENLNGTGGTINLGTGHTLTSIAAASAAYAGVMAGAGGFIYNSYGWTQTLSGANTYGGATAIRAGKVVVSGGNDRLPTTTTVTLGSGTIGGVLQLGDSGGPRNQTLAGLATSGTSTTNAVVGGNATASTLTINNSSAVAYGGLLGGAGANQNNLALTKSGAGTLTLSGANTYSGGTTISGGTVSITSDGNLGAVPGSATVNITLNGGTLLVTPATSPTSLSTTRTSASARAGAPFQLASIVPTT